MAQKNGTAASYDQLTHFEMMVIGLHATCSTFGSVNRFWIVRGVKERK